MKFQTHYKYIDRETKANYVYLKYKKILKGKILDVGADKCYIRSFLPKNTDYIGIGLGESTDVQIDLEKEKIPFKTSSYDVVLCLDVLEHLDSLHSVFDDICRISRKYVIISLPNPYLAFNEYLKRGNYKKKPYQHLKFYGLPIEVPEDRHKWFFSIEEAEYFIINRSRLNNMKVVQIDYEKDGKYKTNIIKTILFRIFFSNYSNFLLNRNLFAGAIWSVLKKNN